MAMKDWKAEGNPQMIVFFFGVTMVPNIELYPPLGYSILDKEDYLPRFNHQKYTTQIGVWRKVG